MLATHEPSFRAMKATFLLPRLVRTHPLTVTSQSTASDLINSTIRSVFITFYLFSILQNSGADDRTGGNGTAPIPRSIRIVFSPSYKSTKKNAYNRSYPTTIYYDSALPPTLHPLFSQCDRTGLPACQTATPAATLRRHGAVRAEPSPAEPRSTRPPQISLANTKTADPYDESLCRLCP